jgi:hypothetical protein
MRLWLARGAPRFAAATTAGARSRAVAVFGDVVIVESTWSGMSSVEGRDPTDRTPFTTKTVWIHEIEDGSIARSVLLYNPGELFN